MTAGAPDRPAAGPGAPDAAPRLRVHVASVVAAFALNGFMFGQWAARIPDIQSQTGLDKPALGLALLMAAIGGVLAMPFGGWLGSRLGTHVVTSLALLGCAITQGVVGFANGFVFLAATLFVFGALQGPMDVCMNANGLAVERSAGGPIIMSRLHGSWSVGSFVGAIASAIAIQFHVALNVQFVAVGILLALGAAVIRVGMLPDRHAQSGGLRLPPRRLAALGFLAYCGLVAEGAASDWSTLYVRDSVAAAESVAPLAFATFSAAMAGMRLIGDSLTVRFGAGTLISWGAATAAAGLALALAVPQPVTAIVGFGLVGGGLASVIPLLFRAGGSQPGIPSAVGIAAVSTMGYAGGLSGPPVIGGAAGIFGLRGALLIVLGMLVLLAISGRRALRGTLPIGQVEEPAIPEFVP